MKWRKGGKRGDAFLYAGDDLIGMVYAETARPTVHSFVRGNPRVGWRFLVWMDRSAKAIKGWSCERLEGAKASCVETAAILLRAASEEGKK